jgi:hypothetical protein
MGHVHVKTMSHRWWSERCHECYFKMCWHFQLEVEIICKIWRSSHEEIFVRKTAHCGDRNRLEGLEYHVFKVADKCEMFVKKMNRTLTCSRTRALIIVNLRFLSIQSLEGSVVLKTCGCVRGKSVYHIRTREIYLCSYMGDVTNLK